MPIHTYCDNKTAISIAHNLILHDGKNILKSIHFIKEKINVGVI